LPSGLRILTNPYNRGYSYDQSLSYRYPYAINGQRSSFCVYKKHNYKIEYFARVVSRGDFQIEPVVIQSMKNPEFINVLRQDTRIVIGD
jgi:hypothetical protein